MVEVHYTWDDQSKTQKYVGYLTKMDDEKITIIDCLESKSMEKSFPTERCVVYGLVRADVVVT